MPGDTPAAFPNYTTLKMSALNVIRMLIPAFRNADASRAAFPHADQAACWQTIMQPWQTPALGAARAFQSEPASTG